MKVLAINLNTYQEENQMDKFMKIAQKIVDDAIDVILFCEAGQSLMASYVQGDIRSDNAIKIICDHVNALLGTQVYQFKWEMVHFGFKIYEEGIAIMSKFPLKDIEATYITKTVDHFTFKSRKVLKATIQDVDFYSCHMGWEDDAHEPFHYQMDQLDLFVQKHSGNRLAFVCGTFNNDMKTKSYRYILEKGYVDVYATIHPDKSQEDTLILPQGFNKRDSYRLDYVFSNIASHQTKQIEYVFENNQRVSDHVGILFEFSHT